MEIFKRIALGALVFGVNALANAMPDDPISRRVRPLIYGLLRCKFGINTIMSGGGYVNGMGVTVGKFCFINRSVYFDLNANVRIGDHVLVGNHVKFITTEHLIGDEKCRGGSVKGRPILVGDGSWIGAGSIIMPGVTLGSGSIVAAGSVVTKNVSANTLVAGIPAVFKKDLPV